MNENHIRTVSVGDRVTVTTPFYSHHQTFRGRVGTVEGRTSRGSVNVRLTTGQLILASGVTRVSEPPTPIFPAGARVAAVRAAKDILGGDPLLSDVTDLADYLLGTPVPATLETLAVAPSDEDLVIRDTDGDRLTASYRSHDADRPVSLAASTVYLSLSQVDQLIARLEAFKAKAQADPTPF